MLKESQEQGTEDNPPSQDTEGSSLQQETSNLLPPTTSSSQQTAKKTGKKRKHEEQDKDLLMLNDAFQVLRSSNEIANDPYYSYGQHLSNELRKYDPTTLSYVKRAFADILFKADQGTLYYRYNTPQISAVSPIEYQVLTSTTASPAQSPAETPQTTSSFSP